MPHGNASQALICLGSWPRTYQSGHHAAVLHPLLVSSLPPSEGSLAGAWLSWFPSITRFVFSVHVVAPVAPATISNPQGVGGAPVRQPAALVMGGVPVEAARETEAEPPISVTVEEGPELLGDAPLASEPAELATATIPGPVVETAAEDVLVAGAGEAGGAREAVGSLVPLASKLEHMSPAVLGKEASSALNQPLASVGGELAPAAFEEVLEVDERVDDPAAPVFEPTAAVVTGDDAAESGEARREETPFTSEAAESGEIPQPADDSLAEAKEHRLDVEGSFTAGIEEPGVAMVDAVNEAISDAVKTEINLLAPDDAGEAPLAVFEGGDIAQPAGVAEEEGASELGKASVDDIAVGAGTSLEAAASEPRTELEHTSMIVGGVRKTEGPAAPAPAADNAPMAEVSVKASVCVRSNSTGRSFFVGGCVELCMSKVRY